MRFPEFTEEWRKYKVSDVLDFYSTNSLSWEQLDYNNEDLYNLHYGLIHVGLPILVDIGQNKLPGIKIECKPKNFELCKEGDVAFADASEDTNDVAKAIEFVNLNNHKTVCGLHTIHGRDNKHLTVLGYKGYAFASPLFHNQIRRIAQGTKIYSISSKNFAECYIGIPSKDEQSKIARLLALIDSRIATQNKIIEDLKKLKSAICNHYFKEGRTKLGDIGTFVRGLTYSSSDVVEDSSSTVVLRSNNIINGEPANLEDLVLVCKNPSDEQILKERDIIICMANGSSSLVGKVSYFNVSSVKVATVGAFCGIYRSNNPIVKWLLQSSHYRKSIHKALQGGNGAIANVYPEDILNISFEIPQNDKLVVNTLSSIENKMLTEQKVLNYLQLLKQYLLSQMFI